MRGLGLNGVPLQSYQRAMWRKEAALKRTGEDYRFEHAVEVRFRDIDLGGHAHHSLAFIYIEEARAAYWREVVGRGSTLEEIGYVLADASIRFRKRVLYPDRLAVRCRVCTLGKKHFEMEYEVRSADQTLLTTARTTQVMYDYASGRSAPMDSRTRQAILEFDGPFE